jgi:hypothetical protein
MIFVAIVGIACYLEVRRTTFLAQMRQHEKLQHAHESREAVRMDHIAAVSHDIRILLGWEEQERKRRRTSEGFTVASYSWWDGNRGWGGSVDDVSRLEALVQLKRDLRVEMDWAQKYARGVSRHSNLKTKYERAASYPWLPVAPDPREERIERTVPKMASTDSAEEEKEPELAVFRFLPSYDPRRRIAIIEKRDYDVLQLVVNHLIDEQNAIHVRHQLPGRATEQKLAVHDKTLTVHDLAIWMNALGDREVKAVGVRVKDELLISLFEKNTAGPYSIDKSKVKNSQIEFLDLNAQYRDRFDLNGALRIGRKYGYGYIIIGRPGFSADGQFALVLVHAGPSPHGVTHLYLLQKVIQNWQVRQSHKVVHT